MLFLITRVGLRRNSSLCPRSARRLVWSPLRASSDHRFIVGALRAQRPCQPPCHSPPGRFSPLPVMILPP
jgi:hypothetical protein